MRVVLATLTVQAAVLLGVSYLGPIHPIGDSVAVFRLQIGAAVFAAAAIYGVLGGNRWFALASIVFGLWSVAPIAAGFAGLSAGQPGPYTLYQKNLYRKQLSRMDVMDEILSQDPDFVTLQEITSHDRRWLGKLFDAYEHKLICGAESESTVGILSRFPLVEGTGFCLDKQRLAAARLRLPDGSEPWLVSIHLGWPYPADQAAQAVIMADVIRGFEGPVLIGGDFNIVPWSSSVRTIAGVAGARRVGPYFGTFVPSQPWLPLPIDGVFLPEGSTGRAEARPAAGSDHLGILARFSL